MMKRGARKQACPYREVAGLWSGIKGLLSARQQAKTFIFKSGDFSMLQEMFAPHQLPKRSYCLRFRGIRESFAFLDGSSRNFNHRHHYHNPPVPYPYLALRSSPPFT